MADKALCAIPDCGKLPRARGFCLKHYQRPPTVVCKVDSCPRMSHGRGYCLKHFRRWKRHGDPTGGTDYRAAQRFFEQATLHQESTDCLIWPFSRNAAGYGLVSLQGRSRIASRAICARVHGPPPSPKHEAAHNCGNGAGGCVNPLHIEWKSPKENTQDKVRHGTHNRGHKNPGAKLSPEAVAFIRENRKTRAIPQRDLAKMYGVCVGAVNLAGRGLTYRDEEQ